VASARLAHGNEQGTTIFHVLMLLLRHRSALPCSGLANSLRQCAVTEWSDFLVVCAESNRHAPKQEKES